MSRLIDVITSSDDAIRNQSLYELCCDQNLESLLSQLDELDQFWRESGNLYHRVRALFFASAIHRYYLTAQFTTCLLYTSPSPRDRTRSRMPSSA